MSCSTPNKYTYDTVKNLLEEEGYLLLTTKEKYSNYKSKITTQCPNKHVWEVNFAQWVQGYRCSHCKHKDMSEVNSLLKALNFTIINDKPRDKMLASCSKGHIFTFNAYSQTPKKCKQCVIVKILDNIKEEKYKIVTSLVEITKLTSKIKLRCPEGHLWETTLDYIRNGNRCGECSPSKKKSLEEIKESFSKEGYTLLETSYANSNVKMRYRCPKGHEHSISWHDWKSGVRCFYCFGTPKKTIEEIEYRVSKEGYTFREPISQYSDSSMKFTLICPKGHEYETCWANWENNRSRCPKCNNTGVSKEELDLKNSLEEIGVSFTHSDNNTIKPKQLDFHYEKEKIAIEYCGLYWHSFNPPSYHRNKLNLCYAKGIRLITVFSDEWLNNKDIVLSRIKNGIGISDRVFGRKCVVREIETTEAKKFVNENHLQGYSPSSKKWGLFYRGDLIAVATVGNMTRNHANKDGLQLLELKRFCSARGITVIGGFSKILKKIKEFASQEGHTHIRSYCDLRWGNGNVYQKNGFNKVRESKYTPHYFKNNKRYRNMTLRKTPEERKTGKTEKELRLEQGYRIIYDCGHQTWDLKI